MSVLGADGVVQQQPVTVGLQDELFVEVLDGLVEGEAVVMTGAAIAGFQLPQLPAGFTPGQFRPGNSVAAAASAALAAAVRAEAAASGRRFSGKRRPTSGRARRRSRKDLSHGLD